MPTLRHYIIVEWLYAHTQTLIDKFKNTYSPTHLSATHAQIHVHAAAAAAAAASVIIIISTAQKETCPSYQ